MSAWHPLLPTCPSPAPRWHQDLTFSGASPIFCSTPILTCTPTRSHSSFSPTLNATHWRSWPWPLVFPTDSGLSVNCFSKALLFLLTLIITIIAQSFKPLSMSLQQTVISSGKNRSVWVYNTGPDVQQYSTHTCQYVGRDEMLWSLGISFIPSGKMGFTFRVSFQSFKFFWILNTILF